LARQIQGNPATVHYFHQDDDPYSELAAQCLLHVRDRYDIRLQCHRVPRPSDAAAPDRARLESWSVRDAKRLGDAFGLNPINSKVWDTLALNNDLQQGGQLRKRLGHYLGATFYFEGEWYWGIDRLHYLEERLSNAGLARARAPQGPLYPPRSLQWRSRPQSPGARATIDFFCSFRSPYTYLAAAQIRKIAQHYGATLRLRPVLPMVMRGLPVPKA
jgi:2-hydroxychromene-2-carboxylate isomerase